MASYVDQGWFEVRLHAQETFLESEPNNVATIQAFGQLLAYPCHAPFCEDSVLQWDKVGLCD